METLVPENVALLSLLYFVGRVWLDLALEIVHLSTSQHDRDNVQNQYNSSVEQKVARVGRKTSKFASIVKISKDEKRISLSLSLSLSLYIRATQIRDIKYTGN